jgi:hypothetical protein
MTIFKKVVIRGKSQGKAILYRSITGPKRSRKLRLPDFQISGT